VVDDFRRVLARVQRDFAFYIGCRSDPEVALAGYDLSPAERTALADPDRLAEMLRGGIDVSRLKITISGSHDWINRAAAATPAVAADHDAKVAGEVEAIRRAGSHGERRGAVVRLLELLG
jgi:hypothetical protein